jgi:hypothetical protein
VCSDGADEQQRDTKEGETDRRAERGRLEKQRPHPAPSLQFACVIRPELVIPVRHTTCRLPGIFYSSFVRNQTFMIA